MPKGPLICRKCNGSGTQVESVYGDLLDQNGKRIGKRITGTSTTLCDRCNGAGVV
jgi:hypothetical protein